VWRDARRDRSAVAEDGAALLATLMAMALMTVLATTLVLATMTEAMIAASYRYGLVTRYLVEGAAERAIDAARGVSDWRLLAARSTQWTFGQSAGTVTVRATSAGLDGGVETLELNAQGTGPAGSVRTLTVGIARDNPPVSGQIRVVSWRENP